MIASKLAELLMETPDAVVNIWSPDVNTYIPVTGLIVNADESEIRLQSDDNDEESN